MISIPGPDALIRVKRARQKTIIIKTPAAIRPKRRKLLRVKSHWVAAVGRPKGSETGDRADIPEVECVTAPCMISSMA